MNIHDFLNPLTLINFTAMIISLISATWAYKNQKYIEKQSKFFGFESQNQIYTALKSLIEENHFNSCKNFLSLPINDYNDAKIIEKKLDIFYNFLDLNKGKINRFFNNEVKKENEKCLLNLNGFYLKLNDISVYSLKNNFWFCGNTILTEDDVKNQNRQYYSDICYLIESLDNLYNLIRKETNNENE